ncbi:MAG: adenylate/guanylate cyclase domain-containing protein, partial [Pyrinomonadaceae bacterium]
GGLHTGPCIAVTLNERLDYFGSTVNLAARLEGQSNGNDVVISNIVYTDPEISEMLINPRNQLVAEPLEMKLKGFSEERFELWRVMRGSEQQVSTPTRRGSDRTGEQR